MGNQDLEEEGHLAGAVHIGGLPQLAGNALVVGVRAMIMFQTLNAPGRMTAHIESRRPRC